MSDLDFEVCEGKSFRDLCGEIVSRSESKKNQVDTLYSDMRDYIKDAASAMNFVPQLKALLDTGIKNDEQLIKLVGIIQRLQAAQIESGVGSMGLTDEEKEQLLREVDDVKKEIDKDVAEEVKEVMQKSSTSGSIENLIKE